MSFPEQLPILSTSFGGACQYFKDAKAKDACTLAADFGLAATFGDLGVQDSFARDFTLNLLIDASLFDGVGASDAYGERFQLIQPNGWALGKNIFGRSDLFFGYNNQDQDGQGFKLNLGLFTPSDMVLALSGAGGYDELKSFLNLNIESPSALAFPENSGIGLAVQQMWPHFSLAGGFNVDVIDGSNDAYLWSRLGAHLGPAAWKNSTVLILSKVISQGYAQEADTIKQDLGSWNLGLATTQNFTENIAFGLEYAHLFGALGDSADSVAVRLLLSGAMYGRSDDAIGLGYAWAQQENLDEDPSSEHGVELFYRWNVYGPLQITPDLQLLINHDGEMNLVPGARIFASF